MGSSDYKGVVVFVHHKCRLPLRVVPLKATTPGGAKIEKSIDLGWCSCNGRTEFDFERTERTVDEAIDLAVEGFLDYVALYHTQGCRTEYDFERLCKEYEKAVVAKWLRKRGLPY